MVNKQDFAMTEVNLVRNIMDIAECHVRKLYEIWAEIGYDTEMIQQRDTVMLEAVKQLFSEMIEEAEDSRVNLSTKIEKLLEEASVLCKELGGNMSTVTEGLEEIPLLTVVEMLNSRMESYRKRKSLLMEKYSELLKKEEVLCNAMDIKKLAKLDFPLEEDLQKFSDYLIEKENKYKELKLEYVEVKNKIETITRELDMQPDTTFHKMIVDSGDFMFSNENMLLLKELHQTMEQKLERAKSYAIELREKLSNLWERLHERLECRDEFLQKWPGYNLKTIEALKSEIRRCEEKKRQNIKLFVEAIRAELNNLWDQCCFGEDQRQGFRSFNSDCYTEDLLDLHELEVEKMKKYLEDNRDILCLAKKRDNLWGKMLDLDSRMHDPNRLFANRGGQLLREEKERKTIQKELPKIEEELKRYLIAYENREGSPFLYLGINLMEAIKERWTDFHEQKEMEKVARKRGKDSEAESKLCGKTLSATKRKIVRCNTPTPIPNKITKLTIEGTAGPSATKSAGKGSSKIARRIFNKEPITKKSTAKLCNEESITASMISYTDFQDGLEKRSADNICRSSVVPGRLLRERNIIVKPPSSASKSSQKYVTPSKPPRKNAPGTSHTQLSVFRTPQNSRLKSPCVSRISMSAPRLTTARRKLPIII